MTEGGNSSFDPSSNRIGQGSQDNQRSRGVGRTCSRSSCRRIATMTLTYVYADSVAVLGPLATFAEPHAYDLCIAHSDRLTVPIGWSVLQHETDGVLTGPSDDDLMIIANAVREVGKRSSEKAEVKKVETALAQEVGRRGHLRAIP